jgi:internalin A
MSALAQQLIAECKRTKAKTLDLGYCGLTKIPDEVFDCVWLEELMLSNSYWDNHKGQWLESKNKGEKNILVNIPERIKRLMQLRKLFIGGERNSKLGIKEIKNLSNLSNLQSLDLSNNQISEVSNLNLTNLQSLDLSNNQISKFSSYNNLIDLRELDLSYNKISEVSSLCNLTKVLTLNLSNNQISEASSLSNLTGLQELDLSYNQISEVSSLSSFMNLEYLYLSDNPFEEEIPQEVRDSGTKAILQWAKENYDKKNKKIALNQAKILLLGNTNVGKSFLLHYLETNEIPQERESTKGLQYKSFEKFGLKLNVYDFGGQEYFHGTHQLFFGEDALHLVLWSKENQLREGQIDRCFELAYWLRCIEQLSKGKQANKSIETILIENKIDRKQANDTYTFEPTLLNLEQLESQFSELNFNQTAVSLTHQKRLQGMLELIEERLQTLPATKANWTQTYQNVIDAINKQKGKGVKVLKAHEIEVKGMKTEDIQTMIPVFHNLGILLFYPAVASVKDLVFIDPQAFLNVLYQEILNESCQKNSGKLTQKDFEKPNELDLSAEQILDLLRYFHVVFEVKQGKNEFFAPQYLPDKSHSLLDFFIEYNFQNATLRLESDSYLLNLVMLQIFTKFGKIVKGNESEDYRNYLFWRDGIVIEKDKQLLYIQYHREKQTIDLYADKNFKNFELQEEIVDWVLEKKAKKYPYYKTMTIADERDLSWIHNPYLQISASIDGENFAKWKDIQQTKVARFSSNGKEFNLADFKPYLKDKNQMKKIFISYSKQDEKMVNDFIKHLAALTHNKLVETWYCTELKAGEEWDETIQTKLNEADIVCFMISPNFMETPYIHKYEVRNALKRYYTDKSKLKIVPIVLDFCNWSNVYEIEKADGAKKECKLSDFTGLPFTMKPIRDFDNQNKAWFIIEDALRKIISEDLNVEVNSDDSVRKLSPQIRQIYEDIMKV